MAIMRIGGDDVKATLEFNLPEENEEFRGAVNGVDFLITLQDLDNEMRACVKYNAEPCSGRLNPTSTDRTKQTVTDHWRTRLRDLARENGVEVW